MASRLYNIINSIVTKKQDKVNFSRYTSFDSKAVASGTSAYTKIGSITVPAGKGIVQAGVSFPSNATGQRRVLISDASSSPSLTRNSAVTQMAVNGVNTNMQVNMLTDTASSTTLYLYAMQNSGSSLNVNGYFGYFIMP